MEKKINYKESFKGFLEEYSKNKEPIEVNFRELVPQLNKIDRATHIIHTYPAKLLSNIPYYFLNNDYFVVKGDSILDPFCGSGTVLLESIISGMHAYGCDANPLARLISEVKTGHYCINKLSQFRNELQRKILVVREFNKFPDVVNLDYWFLPHIKIQLNSILQGINTIKNEKYKSFFLLCFSNCVKKVSLADSRVSVPVRLKINQYPINHPYRKKNENKINYLKEINVFDKFLDIVDANIVRFKNKKKVVLSSEIKAKIISNDARKLNLKDNCIDLIISSPPYAGAQKYIRASSLSLGWTELSKASELKILDKENIGRENYSKSEYALLKESGIEDADKLLKEIYKINPLRAHIASNYLLEMTQAIKESIRVLKPKKHLVLVAANNKVCGYEFKTQDYLRQIAEENGMTTICRLIDDIKSYGLMTKRNKTASVITCEWVLVLKKK